MTHTTQPPGCSTGTSTRATASAPPICVDGETTDLRRPPAARCGGPSTRCAALGRPPGRAGGAGAQRRAGLPGVVPRRAAVGRRAGPAVDDAHPGRGRGDRRRRRARGPWSCPPATRATSTRSPRRRRSCGPAWSSAAEAGPHAAAGPRLAPTSTTPPRRRWRRPARTRPRSGSTARARPACPRASCTATAVPEATAETYARSVLRDRARRPLPVGRQAVLRLRAGQLADVPVRGGGVQRAQPPAPDAARRGRPGAARPRRRCSSPARGSSPPCSTPTRRRRRSPASGAR